MKNCGRVEIVVPNDLRVERVARRYFGFVLGS
jgi:hypothetical protein